jgi:ribosomal protein S18 acetylase RimI-like enzyme
MAIPNIKLREATEEDMDQLLDFEQGVIQAERPFDPTLDSDPIVYYDLHRLISSKDSNLLVATSQDRLVGAGFARIENAKPYNVHKRFCYLGFMYVLPEFRGQGINSMIIEALKEWSISKNITEMRLDVYDLNQAAMKAYMKVGFSKHMTNMRLDLLNK